MNNDRLNHDRLNHDRLNHDRLKLRPSAAHDAAFAEKLRGVMMYG